MNFIDQQDNTEKHLLLISYFFPPLGGAGSLRSLKLAKYLPTYGWQPVVLSVQNPDWYYATDLSLLEELPASVPVIRSRMLRSAWIYRFFNPFRLRAVDGWIRNFVILPDDQIGWLPTGYAKGLRICRRHPIRCIYSTSAPMSSHLIAWGIKQRTGLPWLADFRDEWYENPDFYYPTRMHAGLQYTIEKNVVQLSDHIITAAPGFCRLLAKHPGAEKKCTTVYMGFDPEDFNVSDEDDVSKDPERKFTIAFSGMFYASFRPAGIISVINGLIEAGKIPKDKIKLAFIGANRPEDAGMYDSYEICRFTGFLPHRHALRYARQSDVLLLLLSRERGHFVVPSKTFEYLAAGKPILAVVPKESHVASIIRKTRTGVVADFGDEIAIRRAVVKLYDDWCFNKKSVDPDQSAIESFCIKRQTKRFADLLDKITEMKKKQ